MEFLVFTDAHISKEIVKQLREKGIDALRIEDVPDTELPNNADDDVILDYATEHKRCVLSLDDDFRDWHYQFIGEQKDHYGIFLGNGTLQGNVDIGPIVKTLTEYHQLFEMQDMVNELIPIKK
jgi:predicted nuclease of predicted toxin-antitoxin system